MSFFLSWQVNGSDGMYKYEEIILERVSFTISLPRFSTIPCSLAFSALSSICTFAAVNEMDLWPPGGSKQLCLLRLGLMPYVS